MFIEKVTIQNLGPFGAAPKSASPGYRFAGGQHAFTFERGAVGIFGPNGSGKSSLLDFVYSCLANDFNRFGRVRADCVNLGAGPADEASVRVDFEHNGARVSLYRSLARPRLKERFELREEGGGKPITSAKEGQERLAALGVSRRVLDFCVFKRQPGSPDGAVDDFLRTTPGERAEAYMALNQTGHCQVVHDALGAMLSTERLDDEVVDESDAWAAELAKVGEELAGLAAGRAEAERLLMRPAHLQRAESVLQQVGSLPALTRRLDDLRVQRAEQQTMYDGFAAKAAPVRAALEKAEAGLKAAHRLAQEGRAAMDAWDRHEGAATRRGILEKECASLARLLTKEAPPPADPAAVADLERELADRRRDLEAARKRLKVFDGTGLTVCPTCGQEVAALEAHVAADRQAAAALPKRIAAVDGQLAQLRKQAREAEEYGRWRAAQEALAASNAKALAQAEVPEAPPRPRKSYEKDVQAHARLVEEIEELRGRAARTAERLQAAEAAMNRLAGQIAHVEESVAQATHPAELVERARTRLAEHRRAELDLARLGGEERGLKARQLDLRSRLEGLRVRLRRHKRAQRAGRVLARVRDVFHRQSLPQLVAEANLARMQEDVNRNLALFGDPFWVEADAELSFLVHKPGEAPHRAERLSGGQKVVLALAFWPAVNSLYRAGAGMLVLDEPTANLDEDNVGYLRAALARLARELRGSRQLLMVSHADALTPAFDQVITLTG